MSEEKPRPYEPTVRNPIGGEDKGIITYKHGDPFAIFPNVCILRTGNTISITTAIRKLSEDGKWYKSFVSNVFNAKPPHPLSDKDVHELIERFNRDLYSFVLFGKTGEYKNIDGIILAELDTDQRSEEERLGIILTPPNKQDEEAKNN